MGLPTSPPFLRLACGALALALLLGTGCSRDGILIEITALDDLELTNAEEVLVRYWIAPTGAPPISIPANGAFDDRRSSIRIDPGVDYDSLIVAIVVYDGNVEIAEGWADSAVPVDSLHVVLGPLPVIDSVDPPLIERSASGTPMTITGSGFADFAGMGTGDWEGQLGVYFYAPSVDRVLPDPTSVTRINEGTIEIMLPAWSDYVGSVDLQVTNANGAAGFLPDAVHVYDDNVGFTMQIPNTSIDVSAVESVAFGDHNGDGILDVVAGVRTGSGSALVFVGGNPDGSFTETSRLSVALVTTAIALADIDDAGDSPDLAAGFFCPMPPCACLMPPGDCDGTLAVFMNEDGFNGPGVSGSGVSDAIVSLALADVTGDSRTDLVAITVDAIYVTALDNGDASFIPSAQMVGTGSMVPLWGTAAVADFDGDNRKDVLFPLLNGGALAYLPGSAMDDPSPAAIPIPGDDSSGDLVAADMNGDGFMDVVAGSALTNGYYVYRGDGEGGFMATGPFSVTTDSSEHVAVGDLNGDGLPDVVSCDHDAGDGTWRLSSRVNPGTFEMSMTIPWGLGDCRGVWIADLDGDSDQDVLAVLHDPVAGVDMHVVRFLNTLLP